MAHTRETTAMVDKSRPSGPQYKEPFYCDFQPKNGTGIKVASSIEQIMHVIAVRSAVFISEQSCPFAEEFDGNDFSATHLIFYRNYEPIACIRVRYFAEFAKLERLAVRPTCRHTRIPFSLVWAAINFSRKKGYTKIYGHAQDRLLKFWSHFGAKPLENRRKLVFSDFEYTEMLLEVSPDPEPITLASDPYVLIRAEGAWDRPGILEKSSSRAATSPLREVLPRETRLAETNAYHPST